MGSTLLMETNSRDIRKKKVFLAQEVAGDHIIRFFHPISWSQTKPGQVVYLTGADYEFAVIGPFSVVDVPTRTLKGCGRVFRHNPNHVPKGKKNAPNNQTRQTRRRF